MSDQEFQIAVIAIVFGSAIAIAFFVTIGIVVNNIIKRKSKSNNPIENEEFLDALREFKSKTDKRLSRIESIVLEKESKNEPNKIESESPERLNIKSGNEGTQDESGKESSKGGKLPNMLEH